MSAESRPPTFVETVLRPFVERRTYLALIYALLGLPLGIFYLVFVLTGGFTPEKIAPTCSP